MASPPKTHTRAYRIVTPTYPPFDGTGTHQWGSRWVSPGRFVVHAAETYSLAVLENLVHWQTTALPPSLVCVVAQIPVHLEQQRLDPGDAPVPNGNDYSASRAIGNDWYDRGDAAVLWVPSVLSPHEYNILVNQLHGDFQQILVDDPRPAYVDPRLWPKSE